MTGEVYKIFLKSKICVFLCVLLFALTYGFTIYFTFLGMTGISLLHTVARFNYYICFLMVCMTYFYVFGANRNYVKEISEVMGKRSVYERKAVSLILILTFFWNLGMCVILICCSLRNDGSAYFLSWFPVNYICNVAAPQLICIGITFFVSASWNSPRWMMAEIFFLFLISPFAEEIVWREKPSVPVDALWKVLRRPFEILYQNGVWSTDSQNDFQLERVRIFVLLFWTALLLCAGMVSFGKKKVFTILAGAVAFVFLIGSYQPASVYRLNSSWDGINKDRTDYGIYVSDHAYKSQEVSGFEVKSYILKLAVGNELRVEGSMELRAQDSCEEFTFTLYRGYEVKEVFSQTEGITVTFQQKGDELSVRTSEQVRDVKLGIIYQGHHNKFYSNSRAVMLPGWFPWYPMEGKRQIILEYPEYGRMWGYNPYNRISKAKIRIQSNCELITNLTEKENRVYEGEDDSITLLGGNLEKTQDAVVRNYLPLELYSGYRMEDFIKKQKQDYEEALRTLEQVYGVDVSEFKNKKILFASKDLGRNVTNNFLSVFDEYLLVVPDSITADQLLHYMVLEDCENQKRRESSAVMQLIMNSFFDEDPESIVTNWAENVRMQMEYPEYYQMTLDNPKSFLDILETCDSGEMVKKAVHYLLCPEEYADDQEFLEEMRDEL